MKKLILLSLMAVLVGVSFDSMAWKPEDIEQLYKTGCCPGGNFSNFDFTKDKEHDWNTFGNKFNTFCLDNSNFENAIMTGMKIFCSTYRSKRAIFNGANFKGADLRNATLYYSFEKACFEGAHLEGAHLEHASLCDADFTNAHLEGAHFEQINPIFVDTQLCGTQFINTNLKGANFSCTSVGRSSSSQRSTSFIGCRFSKTTDMREIRFNEIKEVKIGTSEEHAVIYHGQSGIAELQKHINMDDYDKGEEYYLICQSRGLKPDIYRNIIKGEFASSIKSIEIIEPSRSLDNAITTFKNFLKRSDTPVECEIGFYWDWENDPTRFVFYYISREFYVGWKFCQ